MINIIEKMAMGLVCVSRLLPHFVYTQKKKKWS